MTRDALMAWLALEPERDAAHRAVTEEVWSQLRELARSRGLELPEEMPTGHPTNLDMIREACGPDLQDLLRPVRASSKAMERDREEKLIAAVELPVQRGETWRTIIAVQPDGSIHGFATLDDVERLAEVEGVQCRAQPLGPPAADGVLAFEIAAAHEVDVFIFRAKLGKALGTL